MSDRYRDTRYQSEDHYPPEWQRQSPRYEPQPDLRERVARIEVQLEPVSILRDAIHRFGLRQQATERDVSDLKAEVSETVTLADRITAIEIQIAFASRCLKWGLTGALVVGTMLGKLDWKWVAQKLLSWASAG